MYKDFEGTNSKGWIYDIGGIMLRGRNLTRLCLNLAFGASRRRISGNYSAPCWERTGEEIITDLFLGILWTIWLRFTPTGVPIYIEPEAELDQIYHQYGKVTEIEHRDQFLELMTVWRYRTQGPIRTLELLKAPDKRLFGVHLARFSSRRNNMINGQDYRLVLQDCQGHAGNACVY